MIFESFWGFDYYYAIEVDGEIIPCLDRLEFIGKHPFQSSNRVNAWYPPELIGELPALQDLQTQRGPNPTLGFSEDDVAERWNINADDWNATYTEEGDPRRRSLVGIDKICQLLDGVSNKHILDAGCGNGYLCRLLSKRGASVMGVDISKRLIHIAQEQERGQQRNIQYMCASITNLQFIPSGDFDGVVCNTVLVNIPDQNLAITEMARLLKPGAHLVLVLIHPCFSTPGFGPVKRVVDSDRGEDILYWKVDNYFSSAASEFKYRELRVPLINFHRTLSYYINALLDAKLSITYFDEPTPTINDIADAPTFLGLKSQRIPRFLIIRATRI